MCVGAVDRAHAGVATDGAELWLIGACMCVGVVDGAHAGAAADGAELAAQGRAHVRLPAGL